MLANIAAHELIMLDGLFLYRVLVSSEPRTTVRTLNRKKLKKLKGLKPSNLF